MQKKSLLALLLALTMLLSGCALITVDTVKDNAQVIVDVNGETVNKGVITAAVHSQLETNEYYNQLYAAYGIAGSFTTDEDELTHEVIDTYVNQLVAVQKAKELGLNDWTEEELTAISEEAQTNYDSFLASVVSTYMPGVALEGDAKTEAALKYIQEHQTATADGRSTLEDFADAIRDQKMVEKLHDYIIKDVTVSDDEVKAEYDSRVEADKTAFETDPNAYGTKVNGSTAVYYAPAGYRMVKQVLVNVSEEDNAVTQEKQTALTDAQSALAAAAEDADTAALQAAVDEAQAAYDAALAQGMANAKAKADEIYAQATAEDADFDALIAENNNDPGMPAAGYAICEGFTDFVASFTEAGMALEKVGDVSEPVESTYGYHILLYAADVQEGPVDLESVSGGISDELLSNKQNETSEATMAQYVSEANVKTYPERADHH